MQELKTRLISDVVTGKIDVRNVTIPNYECVDEKEDILEDSVNSMEEELNEE